MYHICVFFAMINIVVEELQYDYGDRGHMSVVSNPWLLSWKTTLDKRFMCVTTLHTGVQLLSVMIPKKKLTMINKVHWVHIRKRWFNPLEWRVGLFNTFVHVRELRVTGNVSRTAACMHVIMTKENIHMYKLHHKHYIQYSFPVWFGQWNLSIRNQVLLKNVGSRFRQ